MSECPTNCSKSPEKIILTTFRAIILLIDANTYQDANKVDPIKNLRKKEYEGNSHSNFGSENGLL